MPSVKIDRDLCENTGCCTMVCPEDVFVFEDGRTAIVDAPACTECWICVDNCVSGAIEIE